MLSPNNLHGGVILGPDWNVCEAADRSFTIKLEEEASSNDNIYDRLTNHSFLLNVCLLCTLFVLFKLRKHFKFEE